MNQQEEKHKKHEHLGEAAALGGAALGAYEHHEGKGDPLNAAKHKKEERLAEGAAVGAGGYALYEHHEAKPGQQQVNPEKKHHLFK
jgi:hypothetical protein